MIYYTVENPTVKPVQEWDVPLQSVVYVALKPDAFSGLYMKVINLDDGQWDSSSESGVYPTNSIFGMFVMNSTGVQDFHNYFTENNLILAKMYLGTTPFARTVNARVLGYSKTVDGVKTETVTRYSYTDKNNTSYYFDVLPFIRLSWGNDAWAGSIGGIQVYQTITRNSEGTIIGYGNFISDRAITAGRNAYNMLNVFPDTLDKVALLPIPSFFAIWTRGKTGLRSIRLTNNDTIAEADITTVGSVEINDCPNITYTLAEPITVPITINSQEKSYCYIQF